MGALQLIKKFSPIVELGERRRYEQKTKQKCIGDLPALHWRRRDAGSVYLDDSNCIQIGYGGNAGKSFRDIPVEVAAGWL